MLKLLTGAALALALLPSPCFAQSEELDAPPEARRHRVAIGVQLVPSFPGSGGHRVRPYWDYSSARGGEPFAFEASDESAGAPLLRTGGFEFGPAFSIEGGREVEGVALDDFGTSIELGGFAQAYLTPRVRARAELRQGLGGHEGLVGSAGIDLIARRGDAHVFSIGPRLSWSNGRYQRRYFGVSAAESAATGFAPYAPGAGVHALGVHAGYVAELGPRWSLYSYVKYDRLTGDAARSPVVRTFGDRNQFSGGLAIGYTFGRGAR